MVKKHYVHIIALFLLFLGNQVKAQDYCTPTNIGTNNQYHISNVTLEDINNDSNNSSAVYEYYDTVSTELESGNNYSGSVTYRASRYNTIYLKIWIDFNNDGTFDEATEEVYAFSGLETKNGNYTKNFTVNVPNDVVIATSRMRVAIKHNQSITDPCELQYQAGEVEDYDIIFGSTNQAPTANCIENLDISLDVSGNAVITPQEIDNGSTDDNDAPENLLLSLDRTTFDCLDVGTPVTVTLTVEDSQGLTDTCTTTVSISNYSGDFEAPTIDAVTSYCNYSAPTPVLDYQCGQQITATTSDPTEFNTVGSYTIDWLFNNGSTTVTSTQNITIENPITPTNLSVSDVTENAATISWDDTGSSYKIRYKHTANSTWIEDTSDTNSLLLTGLDDGIEYEVQVAIDASCASFSSSVEFTTIDVEYCDSEVNIGTNNNYYITNVNIGSINNSSDNSADIYTYYSGVSTTITADETFSGSVTYSRSDYNVSGLVIWIDYNNDGDFDDSGEEIFSEIAPGDPTSEITVNLTGILVPATAVEGKTRMRIGVRHNGLPSNACDFDYQNGEIEDYDIFINPQDTSAFEAAIFTQVYDDNSTEKWLEISNNSSESIPANTLIIALYENASGNQSGNTPSATYTITNAIAGNSSLLIKNNSSSFSNYQSTVETNDAITNFSNSDDILIISLTDDSTAWDNRFDVISNIPSNASMVRKDEISIYNSEFNSDEWVNFVDDNLDPYRDLSEGGPERHPHAPLVSEVVNTASNTNIQLGSHSFGSTQIQSDSWSNGIPDRSRAVVINQDYEISTAFAARTLQVASGNKLTITDNSLIVSETVTINLNAEIRLAGSSQMIQTHESLTQVSGSGKLYIDQKSNIASIYRFNYLSSPVNTIGASSYTVENILKDGSEVTAADSTPLDINFIAGYDGNTGNPISIAEYWIYTYTNGDGGRSSWSRKGADGSIGQVDGFTLKGPGTAQNYTFVGTPKDGNLTTTIGGYQSYLVGNPYASAISAKKFIEDNKDAIDGTLYFWEHAGIQDDSSSDTSGHNYSGYIGGYGTRNASMGLAANKVSSNDNSDPNTPSLGNGTYTEPKEYIAVGQGFFVSSDVDGGTITFNNSQREFIELGDKSIFFKNGKSKKEDTKRTNNSDLPIIKLGMDYYNNDDVKMHRQIGISFSKNNSFAYDNGYDSQVFDLGATDVYWKFPDNDTKYIISGVQEISNDLEVPLTVEMGYSGEVSFTIDEWQAIDRDVFLTDKTTNISYKINHNKETLYLDQGTYENRFVITFASDDTLHNDDSSFDDAFLVYFNKYDQNLVIEHSNKLLIDTVNLYNTMGTLVKSWNEFEKNQKENLAIPELNKGVYVVKINFEGTSISKKIIVH
ncbi:GEVED domain-containing protein [Flavicella marina]|uniref:GEVED domain-containing protein n=1 Tax=Flavicella marina TaxID=1475951 RepID=UPI001264F0F7|nr:GEVED domain-containing protein [Flavicella marina]